MTTPSNYPPGVSGNEPEIAGDPYDEVYEMSTHELMREYNAVTAEGWDGDPYYAEAVGDAAAQAGLLDEPSDTELSEAQAAYDDYWRL